MKEFELDSVCSKCGNWGWGATPSIEYKTGVFDIQFQQSLHTGTFGDERAEYLLRTCNRCGYKWPERTIDS